MQPCLNSGKNSVTSQGYMYNHISLNDGDNIVRNALLGDFVVWEHHRVCVHLNKTRSYHLLHI